MTLNGVTELRADGILRLTNETSRLIGHAFYPSPLRLVTSSGGKAVSFSTSFAFAIVPEYPKLGGHGLAFVAAPDPRLPGALPSQYLGLLSAGDNGNATNHVFAVEFDTVQDFEFGDINDNHVGVDLNSLASNASASAAPVNLKSGETVVAWVDYDGDARVLNVSISTTAEKPAAPVVSFRVDLGKVLLEEMYVGFSSSTGLLASSHYLMGWSFRLGTGGNAEAPPLDLKSLPSLPRPKQEGNSTTKILAATFSAFVGVVLLAGATAYAAHRYKHRDVVEPWELDYGPHRFNYSELRRATRGFRDRNHLLGVGGFGKVYRAVLPSSGETVAVKRVSHGSRQGLREFVAEIASIGRLRHRNLVQLQGWCRRRADLLLVYDFSTNHSDADEKHKQQQQLLTWAVRWQVLRDVASALLYLHEGWDRVVLHRDVKASNVLLDAGMRARLGDFGLAKLHERGANPSTTRVVGTLGYLAPELTWTGKATPAADVFAFGALALEVVAGRRPIEPRAPPEELVLAEWAWERYAAGEVGDVVDKRLRGGGEGGGVSRGGGCRRGEGGPLVLAPGPRGPAHHARGRQVP
ncbi:hypothetical protein PR202_ga12090 [Eleusine coracana subsp. coracana]|uniref:non-specific serine/threonine protein kinase n=1 Tax=Eleusine coracana subsp. coracana TaxID=191504 RepID=A0AAV5CB92_ELECO|nr:hypothetical protein PR202_ga12090 [Eleusine coracana subsp. coracana]